MAKHPLRVLRARAEARRLLMDASLTLAMKDRDEFETAEAALGPLYDWAEEQGLVARYGEGFIKAIIEMPFWPSGRPENGGP